MTTETRVRSRAPVGAPMAGAGRAPARDDSWMHTGADAQQRHAQEMERQARLREQGFMPFRFYLRPGEQCHIILLDNGPGPCWFEHNMPDPRNQNRRTAFEYCPKETEVCPLCVSDKESYYVMLLSCLVIKPFQRRDGTTGQWSRMFLAVKAQQHQYFWRLHEQLGGNFRGACLQMSRDSQQSYAIGTPMHVASYSEEQIVQTFQHAEVRGQDNRVIKQANEDLYPFDYGKYFRPQTADEIRTRYGGVAPAGSQAETNQEWGGAAPPAAAAPAAAAPAPNGAGGPPVNAPTPPPPAGAPPMPPTQPVNPPQPNAGVAPPQPNPGGSLPGAPASAPQVDPLAGLNQPGAAAVPPAAGAPTTAAPPAVAPPPATMAPPMAPPPTQPVQPPPMAGQGGGDLDDEIPF